MLTSTTFFFLVVVSFSSLSGSGTARLTGGLNGKSGVNDQLHLNSSGRLMGPSGYLSSRGSSLCCRWGLVPDMFLMLPEKILVT